MSKTTNEKMRISKRYYSINANRYDDVHVNRADEHYIALNYITALINILEVKSVLDIGCGTGRGIGYLIKNHPDIFVRGCDISKEMLKVAIEKHSIPKDYLSVADAASLPFQDESFDVVLEMGMLHHVKEPNKVVKEMLRVAKKAVFISDSNRFGQGNLLIKIMKLVFFKIGVWKFVNYLKTGGKLYSFSEGDGVAYSYSVYDSMPIIVKSCSSVISIPTIGKGNLSVFPLLNSPHLLICAVKDYKG